MEQQRCMIVGVGQKMGQAISRAFAQEGFDMVLASRNPRNLEPYAEEAQKNGVSVETEEIDVTDPDSVVACVDRVIGRGGVPDVVVYNVAILAEEKPSELTPEGLLETLDANLLGAVSLTQAILPKMRERGSGTILYTGGGFGIDPSTTFTSHSLGKAALRNYALALHKELTPEGIHAGTITITRPVREGTDFDPDDIAAHYVVLHKETPPDWRWEILHK